MSNYERVLQVLRAAGEEDLAQYVEGMFRFADKRVGALTDLAGTVGLKAGQSVTGAVPNAIREIETLRQIRKLLE